MAGREEQGRSTSCRRTTLRYCCSCVSTTKTRQTLGRGNGHLSSAPLFQFRASATSKKTRTKLVCFSSRPPILFRSNAPPLRPPQSFHLLDRAPVLLELEQRARGRHVEHPQRSARVPRHQVPLLVGRRRLNTPPRRTGIVAVAVAGRGQCLLSASARRGVGDAGGSVRGGGEMVALRSRDEIPHPVGVFSGPMRRGAGAG